jgi:hypothetical protein
MEEFLDDFAAKKVSRVKIRAFSPSVFPMVSKIHLTFIKTHSRIEGFWGRHFDRILRLEVVKNK